METMEKISQPKIEKQPEAGKLDSIIDATLTQETNALELEIKEAEQQLGVSSEAALEGRGETTAQETIKEEKAEEIKGPIISQQEKLDSEMNVSRNGWVSYWIKRLEPEISILPDEIRTEIKMKGDENLRGSRIFARYINKRVAAKRFELAKRRIMFDFKVELRAIDERKEMAVEKDQDMRTLFYDELNQSLFVKNKEGDKQEITIGDLIGDYTWGIKYNPDLSIKPALWRKIRKISALHETKDKISEIYDNELILSLPWVQKGVGSIALPILEKQIKQYIEKEKGTKAGFAGILAERMIIEFLTRIQYNNPSLRMKVEASNALEDTVLKYDFKLIVKKRRGVELESEDMPREEFIRNKKTRGTQFTIMKDESNVKKKKQSIEKAEKEIIKYKDYVKKLVDEIVLVRLPALRSFLDLYIRWMKEGKPSGGPEQYFSREQKLEIFKQATNGLLDISEQELTKLKI